MLFASPRAKLSAAMRFHSAAGRTWKVWRGCCAATRRDRVAGLLARSLRALLHARFRSWAARASSLQHGIGGPPRIALCLANARLRRRTQGSARRERLGARHSALGQCRAERAALRRWAEAMTALRGRERRVGLLAGWAAAAGLDRAMVAWCMLVQASWERRAMVRRGEAAHSASCAVRAVQLWAAATRRAFAFTNLLEVVRNVCEESRATDGLRVWAASAAPRRLCRRGAARATLQRRGFDGAAGGWAGTFAESAPALGRAARVRLWLLRRGAAAWRDWCAAARRRHALVSALAAQRAIRSLGARLRVLCDHCRCARGARAVLACAVRAWLRDALCTLRAHWRRRSATRAAQHSAAMRREAAYRASAFHRMRSSAAAARRAAVDMVRAGAQINAALLLEPRLRDALHTCVARWWLLLLTRCLGSWRWHASGRVRRRAAAHCVLLVRCVSLLRAVFDGWRAVMWHAQLLRHARASLETDRRCSPEFEQRSSRDEQTEAIRGATHASLAPSGMPASPAAVVEPNEVHARMEHLVQRRPLSRFLAQRATLSHPWLRAPSCGARVVGVAASPCTPARLGGQGGLDSPARHLLTPGTAVPLV